MPSVSEIMRWRWAPCAGLVLGSLSFVALALLLIPDHVGQQPTAVRDARGAPTTVPALQVAPGAAVTSEQAPEYALKPGTRRERRSRRQRAASDEPAPEALGGDPVQSFFPEAAPALPPPLPDTPPPPEPPPARIP